MRVAALLLVLLQTLFGCDAAFESCLKKVNDLNVTHSGSLFIPLQNNVTLIYSDTPVANALKKDPFLHLYLIHSPQKVQHPFKINRFLPSSDLAAIQREIICGKIKHHQEGLDHLARFSKQIFAPSVLLNGCCELVAVATHKGIVEKPYIEHFLRFGGEYGDLGVRVKRCKKHLVVEYVNPFVKTPLQRGDRILKLNAMKIDDLALFNKKVLFAQVGSWCEVEVERCGKKRLLKSMVHKRKGGGFLSDSFFETLGVYLDDSLKVISSDFSKFKRGDIIKVVDGKRVATQEEIKKALTEVHSKSFLVGLNRRGLDIFIKIGSD